jgi:hypothetical protein
MHGGRIEARSEGEGKGSEFLVTLPLAVDVPTSLTGGGMDAEARERPPRCRILVVDDNRDSADALGLLLEASGAEVRVVYAGMVGVGLSCRGRLTGSTAAAAISDCVPRA